MSTVVVAKTQRQTAPAIKNQSFQAYQPTKVAPLQKAMQNPRPHKYEVNSI
jgi:hypothetical protein